MAFEERRLVDGILSGRAGLPALRLAGRLEIFSLAAHRETTGATEAEQTEWDGAFGKLTRGQIVPSGGMPASRSSTRPVLLLGASGAVEAIIAVAGIIDCNNPGGVNDTGQFTAAPTQHRA